MELLLAPIYTSILAAGLTGYRLAWIRWQWAQDRSTYIFTMAATGALTALILGPIPIQAAGKTIGIASGGILGFVWVFCLWSRMGNLVAEHKEAKK